MADKIDYIKDRRGRKRFPITHEKGVRDSNWVRLEEKLNGIELGKQDALVSGENIKTIGGQSILGEGNIPVGDANAVKYDSQSLTEAQKEQARTNIGAASSAEVASLADQKYEGPYASAAELPEASAQTMGAIYLVGPDANDEYERKITKLSGSTYSWASLGNTAIALANYASKESLNGLQAKVDNLQSFYDVTEKNDGASYANLYFALSAIPSEDRKELMTIRYLNSVSNDYERWSFEGVSVTDFLELEKWKGENGYSYKKQSFVYTNQMGVAVPAVGQVVSFASVNAYAKTIFFGCKPGDIVVFSGNRGNGQNYPYSFLDKDYKVLETDSTTTDFTDAVRVAPSNCAFALIQNSSHASAYCNYFEKKSDFAEADSDVLVYDINHGLDNLFRDGNGNYIRGAMSEANSIGTLVEGNYLISKQIPISLGDEITFRLQKTYQKAYVFDGTNYVILYKDTTHLNDDNFRTITYKVVNKRNSHFVLYTQKDGPSFFSVTVKHGSPITEKTHLTLDDCFLVEGGNYQSGLVNVSLGDSVDFLAASVIYPYLSPSLFDAKMNEYGKILVKGPTNTWTEATKEIPAEASYVAFCGQNSSVAFYLSVHKLPYGSLDQKLLNDVEYNLPHQDTIIKANDKYDGIYTINGVEYYASVVNHSGIAIMENSIIAGGNIKLTTVSGNTHSGYCFLYKKTTNKGRSWSEARIAIQTIPWSATTLVTVATASLVVDRSNNRLYLFFGLTNTDELKAAYGDASTYPQRLCYIYSDDEGESWVFDTNDLPFDITSVPYAKFPFTSNIWTGSSMGCYTKNGLICMSLCAASGSGVGHFHNMLLYSTDHGSTWECTGDYTPNGNGNEVGLYEYADNRLMFIVRDVTDDSGQKQVYKLNVANINERASWLPVYDEELSASHLWQESSGYGEQGETSGFARVIGNASSIHLYAQEMDDGKNVSLLVSSDLKKFIPVYNLYRGTYHERFYSYVVAYKQSILMATRQNHEIRVAILDGLYDTIMSVGQMDEKIVAVDNVVFDAGDSQETLIGKLNALTESLKANGYMKDWRNVTDKLGFAIEAKVAPQYEGFTTAETNVGLAYMYDNSVSTTKYRMKVPVQNYPANASTAVMYFSRCNGSKVSATMTKNAELSDENYLVFDYNGSKGGILRVLYFEWYKGVSPTVATTEGVEIYFWR